MKSKLILSALFKFRNISTLLLCTSGVFALQRWMEQMQMNMDTFIELPLNTALYLGSTVVYAVLVIQSLMSKSFHEEFNKKQKLREIKALNNECFRLALEAKKHTNQAYYQKLKKVMDDLNEIYNSFIKGERGYLKEKIVEQTLNLVLSYVKLLTNFCIRSRELSDVDVSEIADRINKNNRKLAFVKDPDAAKDIQLIVEMDEKLISRLKEEKTELERISTKLDYIESMVGMFKHQILTSVESEEMVSKIGNAVNEAIALDNVLEERRRNRARA